MKKVILTTLITVISATILFVDNGCKKGSGDPGISFRSRKARVEGDWTLKSSALNLKKTTTSVSGTVNDSKDEIVFDGAEITDTHSETTLGETSVIKYTETLTYTFDKNGTWTSKRETKTTRSDSTQIPTNGFLYLYLKVTTAKTTTTSTGTWDFLNGVGDFKKKENMLLSTTSATEKVEETGVFNPLEAAAPPLDNEVVKTVTENKYDSNNEIWTLTTLKNKEMSVKMTYDSKYSRTVNGVADATTIVQSGEGSMDFSQ